MFFWEMNLNSCMMSGSMALIWSLDVRVSSPKTRYDSALLNDRGNIHYSVENRIPKFKYTTLLLRFAIYQHYHTTTNTTTTLTQELGTN